MNLISSISKASSFQMNNLNLHLAYAKKNKSLIQLGPPESLALYTACFYFILN